MKNYIFMTRYFFKFHDGKERTYPLPDSLYDSDGVINEEVLLLSINKFLKKYRTNEINLIILDPNSHVDIKTLNNTLNSNQELIFNDDFISTVFSSDPNYVFNMDSKTINTVKEIAVDLKIKINLFSLFDVLLCFGNVNKDSIFLLYERDFYFLVIFENGFPIKYFYDDRSFFNNRSIQNLKNEMYLTDEIKQNQDFATFVEITGIICDIVKDESKFEMYLISDYISSNIDDYLKTLNFKKICKVAIFDFININSERLYLNYNQPCKKRNHSKLIKIFIVFIFIFILLYILRLNKQLSNDINTLQSEYEILSDIKVEKILNDAKQEKNMLLESSLNEEYESCLNAYNFINGKQVINILMELSKNYNILNAEYTDDKLEVTLDSTDEINSKYEKNISKIINYNGKIRYELKFEVINEENK